MLEAVGSRSGDARATFEDSSSRYYRFCVGDDVWDDDLDSLSDAGSYKHDDDVFRYENRGILNIPK